jgi:preprotein translocase subunit SecG
VVLNTKELKLSILLSLILTVQILSAVVMIGLILIQHGKGADMGAAFGGGASGSLFGATGSANFLSRTTAILATVFFVATMALAFFGTAARPTAGGSVLEGAASGIPATAASAPAVAASGAAAVPVPAAASAPTGAAQIPSK